MRTYIWVALASMSAVFASIGTSFGGVSNAPAIPPSPLLHQVAQSNVAVDLIDFVQIPASGNGAPLARINYLFHAGDGSKRLFVNDMRGNIYVIRNGVLLPAPFLDVAAIRGSVFVKESSEQGLATFAFHPDFARKGTRGFGKFYTFHSESVGSVGAEHTPVFMGPENPPDHFKVVTEWSVDPKNPDRIDPSSRRDLMRLGPWRQDHGGGQLGFDPGERPGDPDYGLLYISVGDGGNSAKPTGKVDAYHEAQNTTTPFGKILRINPLQSGSQHYSVPLTNPFVHRKGFLPEIWAYGLRNPERFSWDMGGQRKMLIADIGQKTIEEINLGRAGANYGWSIFEGNFLVEHQDENRLLPAPASNALASYTFPVAAYDHSDGLAITGGYVYRGRLMPELVGKYIFGDIVTGDIFFADAASMEAGIRTKIFKLKLYYRGKETSLAADVFGSAGRADLRFGMGEDGEIYVLTKTDGMVRKLARHNK